jgi:hypothetical protein
MEEYGEEDGLVTLRSGTGTATAPEPTGLFNAQRRYTLFYTSSTHSGFVNRN